MSTTIEGVKTVIQSIVEQRGAIRPTELVEAARPKSSPAHGAFLWDDKKAGAEYRLIQARKYIRIVRVEIDGEPERLIHIPKVQTIDMRDESDEGEYKPIRAVVESPTDYELALSECRKTLAAAKRAFDTLVEAAKGSSNNQSAKLALLSRGLEMMEKALH